MTGYGWTIAALPSTALGTDSSPVGRYEEYSERVNSVIPVLAEGMKTNAFDTTHVACLGQPRSPTAGAGLHRPWKVFSPIRA